VRALLVFLGVSVAGLVGLTIYQTVVELEGEELAYADFPDNDARLAFLREKGFLADPACAPEVRDLAYVGFQDQWISFVLGPGGGEISCYDAPERVFPPNSEESMWRDCRHETGGSDAAALHRYTCANA
jgi:hypothetical protein